MECGGDPKTLMTIFRALTISKIDFILIVYNSAKNYNLTSIEPILNEAMRIVSRYFKSSLISSFQIITNEPPLQLKRDKLSFEYC